MAAANLSYHLPIKQVQNKANTTPFTSAQPEAAGQTFLFGSPVQLNGSGFVQAWDGTTVSAGILGVAESFGQNLGSAGAGAPVPPFGGITGTIAIATYGTVPNQPSGVNIAIGTPVADGRTLYMEPNQDNIFQALFDKDANGYWYIDKNKTGGSAVVQIVALPLGSYLNAPVAFVFLTAAIQVA
jgi:hypothetical protein